MYICTMHIWIIGDEARYEALRQNLFKEDHCHFTTENYPSPDNKIDIVIDTLWDTDPNDRLMKLLDYTDCAIWLHAMNATLRSTLYSMNSNTDRAITSINAIPCYLSAPALEMVFHNSQAKTHTSEILSILNKKIIEVPSQVGMISPRIIGMIINEAYYTIQEGITSRADADLSMRLGTNYPYGPFEWANKWGIKNIYQLLRALEKETGDPRYKPSALLRIEAENTMS